MDIPDINIDSNKLFYVALGLASIFVVIMFTLSIGGFNPSVGVVAESPEYPDGMSHTNPFTETAFQKHSVTLPLQYSDYRYSFGKQVTSNHRGIVESNWTHRRFSQTGTPNVLISKQKSGSNTTEQTYIYETQEKMLEYDGSEVTTSDRESVLKNQVIVSVDMVEQITHIRWSADSTTTLSNGDKAIKYTPGHVQTNQIDHLTSVNSVDGELLVNQETGVITSYEVNIRGTSNEYSSSESILITYEYVFTKSDPLEKPDWVTEYESESESET